MIERCCCTAGSLPRSPTIRKTPPSMRYAHAAGYGVVVADDTVTDGTAESAAAAAVDAAADRATGAPRGVPRGPVPTQAAPGLPRFSPIFNFRDVGGHRGL